MSSVISALLPIAEDIPGIEGACCMACIGALLPEPIPEPPATLLPAENESDERLRAARRVSG